MTDGVPMKYVVDKNRRHTQVLEERDGDGHLVAAYVYGDDLISRRRGGSVLYYHYDGLGSVTALTDGAGNVTDTYVYEAFGGLLRHDGEAGNSYLFAGEQYDPNAGFYYLRTRYYNTGNGRFLTSDSWKGNMARPRTLNKYAYADANPVNRKDPSGRFSIGEMTAVTSIRNILTDIQLNTASSILDARDQDESGAYTNAGVAAAGMLGKSLKKIRPFFKGRRAKGFDWDHIFERHSDFGKIARHRSTGTIFEGLTEKQIQARVQAAWKNRRAIRRQLDPDGVTRIRYHGVDPVSGQIIEMWQNQATGIVETAYPLL